MTFKSLFGQFTILSLSFVTFRVSHFRVSHITHETFKLCLQNILNMSKNARVYFGVLQARHKAESEAAQLEVDRASFLLELGMVEDEMSSLQSQVDKDWKAMEEEY